MPQGACRGLLWLELVDKRRGGKLCGTRPLGRTPRLPTTRGRQDAENVRQMISCGATERSSTLLRTIGFSKTRLCQIRHRSPVHILAGIAAANSRWPAGQYLLNEYNTFCMNAAIDPDGAPIHRPFDVRSSVWIAPLSTLMESARKRKFGADEARRQPLESAPLESAPLELDASGVRCGSQKLPQQSAAVRLQHFSPRRVLTHLHFQLAFSQHERSRTGDYRFEPMS